MAAWMRSERAVRPRYGWPVRSVMSTFSAVAAAVMNEWVAGLWPRSTWATRLLEHGRAAASWVWLSPRSFLTRATRCLIVVPSTIDLAHLLNSFGNCQDTREVLFVRNTGWLGSRGGPCPLLQVVGQEQEDPEQRGPGDEHREVGAAPVAVQQHTRRLQRVSRPALPQREDGQQHHPGGEESVGGRRVPAVGGRVREPVDQAEQAAGDQRHAGDVEPGPGLGRLGFQQQRSAGEGGRPSAAPGLPRPG